MTKPRAELVRDLVALPASPDDTAISLFTPALIDFSYWLDDRASAANDDDITKPPADVTPLDQQINVMSAISTAAIHWPQNPGFAMHPFVSFCPWRQIADEQSNPPVTPTQFDLVKQAILSKGFIGVKIYPLMGFRPIGNTAADAPLYPQRLTKLRDFADAMNQALAMLYAWCIAEDVPVMAHCSFSQYPNPKAGALGGPAGWLQVLDWPAFRDLRLNLAHCGGVWDLAAARAKTVEQQAGGLWPTSVVAALGKPQYPNLYADLADYNDVLKCATSLAPNGPAPAGGDASSITTLTRLVAANPDARTRIMYGTDFMFLTLYSGTDNYAAEMRGCLAPLLGIAPSDLMGGNAARFLGLTDSKSGTHKRLDAFRGDTFLARWET